MPSDPWSFPVTTLPALQAVQAAKAQNPEISAMLDLELRRAMFRDWRCISVFPILFEVAGELAGLDVARLRSDVAGGEGWAQIWNDLEQLVPLVPGSPTFILPDGSVHHNPGIEVEGLADGAAGGHEARSGRRRGPGRAGSSSSAGRLNDGVPADVARTQECAGSINRNAPMDRVGRERVVDTTVEHDERNDERADSSGQDSDEGRGESTTTIWFAFAANLVIACAKLVGGLISGSAAMLAEAGHSVADTVNQVFLRVSMTLGARPADEEHPFGYGKERFFWAFLAATFIFVAGAVFSWGEGVRALFASGGEESYLIAYVVLAVAFVAEGISLIRALRQVGREAAAEGRTRREHLRVTKDPTTKVVVLEDSAAVVGVVIAAAGIGLHELTGDHRFDGYASLLIGALLAFVAYRLGRDTKDLLLGEAALPEDRAAIRRAVERHEEVVEVYEVLTMSTGPRSLLVAVRAELAARLDSTDVHRTCTQIERDVARRGPRCRPVLHRSDAANRPTPTPLTERDHRRTHRAPCLIPDSARACRCVRPSPTRRRERRRSLRRVGLRGADEPFVATRAVRLPVPNP